MTLRRAALGKISGTRPPKDRSSADTNSLGDDAHRYAATAQLHRFGIASEPLFTSLCALQLRTGEPSGGTLILIENFYRSSRLPHHLLRGLTDKAVLAIDETFKRLAEVFEQVEAVSDLHRLWRAISCTLGIS